MQWNDVTHEHNNKEALVSRRIEFQHDAWREVYRGTIVCEQDAVPLFRVHCQEVHFFSGPWEVEIIE